MFGLFAGKSYYPDGGWNDHIKSCDTLEECQGMIKVVKEKNPAYHPNDKKHKGPEFWTDTYIVNNGEEYRCDWWHIVNLVTGEIVYQ